MDAQKSSQVPVDRGSALSAAAILGGALVLSWGMSGSEPRYQLAGSGDTVVRMDTDSGELLACNPHGCSQIQPPDRAKTFGMVGIGIGDSKKKLAAPDQNKSQVP